MTRDYSRDERAFLGGLRSMDPLVAALATLGRPLTEGVVDGDTWYFARRWRTPDGRAWLEVRLPGAESRAVAVRAAIGANARVRLCQVRAVAPADGSERDCEWSSVALEFDRAGRAAPLPDPLPGDSLDGHDKVYRPSIATDVLVHEARETWAPDAEWGHTIALGDPPRLGDPRLDGVLDAARIAARVEWLPDAVRVVALDGTRQTRFLEPAELVRLRELLGLGGSAAE